MINLRSLPAPAGRYQFRVLPVFFLLFASTALHAQGNYEVQVYGSETMAPGRTMFELHSNFTFQGSKSTIDGVRGDEHALHETLEITQGVNDWFEVGFYVFTSYRASEGYQWVGDHIRPRVRVPPSWHWPVGVSISTELGYMRRSYAPDTWTWEIRPIVDKQAGHWYLAVNPALERSFHGLSVPSGVTFAPGVKVSYDVTKKVTMGFEYYGDLGPVTGFDPLHEQLQALYLPTLDLNLSEDWEFNFAPGIGLTGNTDHFLIKMIIGRRTHLGK